jgi:hypothetical protein
MSSDPWDLAMLAQLREPTSSRYLVATPLQWPYMRAVADRSHSPVDRSLGAAPEACVQKGGALLVLLSEGKRVLYFGREELAAVRGRAWWRPGMPPAEAWQHMRKDKGKEGHAVCAEAAKAAKAMQ